MRFLSLAFISILAATTAASPFYVPYSNADLSGCPAAKAIYNKYLAPIAKLPQAEVDQLPEEAKHAPGNYFSQAAEDIDYQLRKCEEGNGEDTSFFDAYKDLEGQ